MRYLTLNFERGATDGLALRVGDARRVDAGVLAAHVTDLQRQQAEIVLRHRNKTQCTVLRRVNRCRLFDMPRDNIAFKNYKS